MSVPICAIYAFYNSDEGQYGLALALALVVSLGVELATFATYPLDDIDVRDRHLLLFVEHILAAAAQYSEMMTSVFRIREKLNNNID